MFQGQVDQAGNMWLEVEQQLSNSPLINMGTVCQDTALWVSMISAGVMQDFTNCTVSPSQALGLSRNNNGQKTAQITSLENCGDSVCVGAELHLYREEAVTFKHMLVRDKLLYLVYFIVYNFLVIICKNNEDWDRNLICDFELRTDFKNWN